MHKRWFYILILIVLLSGCTTPSHRSAKEHNPPNSSIQPFATNTPDLAGGSEADIRKAEEPLTLSQLRKKYRSNFFFTAPDQSKQQVALTFDDVPDRLFTLQLLDVLKEYKVKATFFVVGNRAQENPDVIERMLREGHALGNHSYSHANLLKATDDEFHHEVMKTQAVIRQITDGYQMRYIRPPYGNITEEQVKWLISQRMQIVNWDVDSLDWTSIPADEVESNIMKDVKSGSIILQHGAGGEGEDLSGTVQALPRIIKQLRERGMEFVTIPQMLGGEQ